MKTNKLVALVSAFITSLAALFFIAAPHAFAATMTWTGGGSDTNMSTAANWGGTAPSAADDLVFPANNAKLTVVNDYTAGTSFNSITFSGAATQASNYTISGNAFVVVAGITNSMTTSSSTIFQTISAPVTLGGAQTITATNAIISFTNFDTATYPVTLSGKVSISGVLSGSGNITHTGTDTYLGLSGNNSGYTGAFIVTSGYIETQSATALGASSGVTLAAGAALNFCSVTSDRTISVPIILNSNSFASITTSQNSCHAGGTISGSPTLTLSGSVTLNADAVYSGYESNLKIAGTYTPNGHSFTVVAGGTGSLILPSGTVTSATVTTNYTDNSPSTIVSVPVNNIGIVDGTYGDTYVGGTLKGTGTLKTLDAISGGIVAPGHSPGVLTILTSLTLEDGSHYQAELFNKDSYDQFKVGDASITTGHAVILGSTTDGGATVTGNPILDVSLYAGATIKATDTFTIIDNLSKTDVAGIFKGLPEGATFALNGGVMKITYKGGDGNDVVLSVVTVPTVGNTGFKLLLSSPLTIVLATAALTSGAYVLSRRYFVAAKTK